MSGASYGPFHTASQRENARRRLRWAPFWAPGEQEVPALGLCRPEPVPGRAVLLVCVGDGLSGARRGGAALLGRDPALVAQARLDGCDIERTHRDRAREWAGNGRHAVPMVGAWPTERTAMIALTDGLPPRLTGDSLGAAWALAEVSSWLGLAIPSEVAVSATLTKGVLGEVDGLREKCMVIAEKLPAVTTLLVAPGSADTARHEAAAVAPGLCVITCATLDEAVAALWPDAEARIAERLRRDASLSRQVISVALSDAPCPVRWAAIARSASVIEANGMAGAVARVAIPSAVARRHDGGDDLLPWPEDEAILAIPRARAAELLSHVVQSAADHADAPSRAYAARGEAWLARWSYAWPDTHLGSLAGAVGRAWVAAGAYPEGLQALAQVSASMVEIDRPEAASRPVCEGLRVSALVGEDLLCERFLRWAELLSDHPETSHASRRFLDVARLWAGTLRGEHEAVLAWEPTAPWWWHYDAVLMARVSRLKINSMVACACVEDAREMAARLPNSDSLAVRRQAAIVGAMLGAPGTAYLDNPEVRRLRERGLSDADVLRHLRY
jgi:hypothetical protein